MVKIKIAVLDQNKVEQFGTKMFEADKADLEVIEEHIYQIMKEIEHSNGGKNATGS